MKTKNKIILSILLVIIFLLATFVTYFIVRNINKNKNYAVTDDCIYEESMYESEKAQEIETNSTTEKISPNAFFSIKKYYKTCGHTTEEDVELPAELVNKTQEEIENTYKDFVVETFNPNELVLYKEIDGKCNEHYKIKEEDGVIVVYNTNENGEEILYDKTGISTQYLTENDVANIRKGLEIYGKQNLNRFIEDFE